MSKLAVAILAGGKSSRMGQDKSFVTIQGKPMIEHVLARVSGLGEDETLLITNHPEDYAHLDVPTYTDVLPDKGSLGGIYSALRHSSCEYTLVVACDMPFLNANILKYMIGLIDEYEYDVIVPRVEGYPQGLHAIYRQTCVEPIKERINADRLKVIGFYDQMSVRYLDEPEYAHFDLSGRAFSNINTPEEAHATQQSVKQNTL